MKVLSLFSGVGGFDLGLERAGMETVFQCEWDKHATKILERHWPDVPRWDDVSTLTGKHILAHAPVIDVVAWGSPCQDLSIAGKRAGLEGSRSGLFHEGIRIIKELRKETNNVYPRISLWENVYGALSSNKGADFGVILDEMAEAGSLVQEWRVLDAQYFGVPQRRRRVFLVSVFDTATAARCPDPLLPVSESVRGDTPTSGTPGQEPTGTTPESVASRGLRMRGFGDYADDDTAAAIKARDYKDATDLVVGENYARPVGTAVLGSEIIGSLNAVDYKWPQNQQLDENKFIVVDEKPILIDRGAFNQGQNALYKPIISDDPVIPSLVARGPHAVATFTKAKRAQTSTDDETWVEGKPAPTLNAFDQGDTRATTVIVGDERTYRDVTGALLGRDSFGPNHEGARDGKLILEPILIDGRRVDDVRVYDPPVQTLQARMGTGGNNTPMVAFGIQGNPQAEAFDEYNDTLGGDVHHALRAGTKQSTGVVVDNEIVGTLRSGGDGGVPSSRGEHLVIESTMVAQAIPIQDGRDMEHHQNGLGIGEEGAPSYTLMTTGGQAVAHGIQGNVIGRQDHNGPAEKGHTDEGDPMFTLTGTDIHAVAYTLRMREGKPGGGKGPLVTPEKSGTLAARSNDQTVFQPQAEAYDQYNDTLGKDVHHSLRAGRQSTGVVVGRQDHNGPAGKGHNENKVVVELPVAYSIREDAKANTFSATELDRSNALNALRPSPQSHHAQMFISEPTMAVRRLTPIECERLMGWPDGWTEGQADTHRYKQCGNGVASPVATWIGQQIINL